MSSNQEVRHQQPRRRGPMGRGMQPGEKPKDLKKSIKQLMQYIGKYKIGIFIVMICAACSTVFTVIGPKILGQSTGLSPFWVVFAIFLGNGLFGIVGLFIGVPLWAVVYYLIKRYVNYRIRIKEHVEAEHIQK